MSDVKAFPELEKLTEQMSELVHNWGFKRIHGKIWSLLYLSERPLDAADLISQLQISKALVSISVRELLDAGAVKDVGRSQRGTHLFRANTDIAAIAFEVLRKRERDMLAKTQDALTALAGIQAETLKTFEISAKHVENLQIEIRNASMLLEGLVETQESQQTLAVITEPAEPISLSASQPGSASGLSSGSMSSSSGSAPASSSSSSSSSFSSMMSSSTVMALPYSTRASGG